MVQDLKYTKNEIKSMALFARYNPAPVFRFDKNGNILQSNFAADEMFSEVISKNGKAFEMIKGIDQSKVEKCIRDGDILSLVETIDYKNVRFELRGIPELEVMQVYGADITEIVNTQYENEKLSTAVSQTSNSVMITNVKGNIEFVNHAFELISGYNREDVIGKNPKILKTNYLSKEIYQELWKTISSGKVWKGEFHNRRKDLTTYWEEATISPIRNRNGVIQNYIAVKEDITERKKIAEKLHSMALFAELNPEPVIRFADNGLILQSNKAANDIFSKETLLGFEIQNLVSETQNINFSDFIKTNKIQTIDTQFENKHYRFILKGIEEINVCQMYGSDITVRIEAQKEAESMALFAKLNPEPVFRFNKNGLILQSNPAANNAFLLESIVDMQIKELIPEISDIDFLEFIKQNKLLTITAEIGDKIMRFILRGLDHLNICQIYGSDITERVKAQHKIEEQKKSITDSIQYAKRIQNAILPNHKIMDKYFADHFIYFKPRDIVSGDFYWMTEKNNKLVLVAADSTGHGVPGAFMSMLGISFLNEIVNKHSSLKASTILKELRKLVKSTLAQSGKSTSDGMDIALVVVDKEKMQINYAGAYNPLYIVRNKELLITKADRMPIGSYVTDDKSFTNHEIDIKKGDSLFIFSDGYADQFGGKTNTKFSTKELKKLLTEISDLNAQEQLDILDQKFLEWKGNYKQIDDVLIIGAKI
ncbi:MAG: PAS domain S-box protein [Bacteroidales bacterium]|jgi:PAS domain S-box-containing protein|nr:PAS domain S-box protein [Bacteroidales bacterium]